MEEFNNLLQTQQQVITGMERLWSNFKKDSQERKSPDYIKRKLETLDMYWSEFHTNHEKWDDKIPENMKTESIKIKQEFQNMSSFTIPRWLGTGSEIEFELHGFCDASQKAFACVIYCKTIIKPNSKIVLIAAKSRLVPNNKKITLPRLDLSGAVLLSKLMEKVKKSLTHHNIKMYGWVDSTAVLGWIQGGPGRWKAYVANRVQQITAIMPSNCWRYVKSADNPADCASRGLTPGQLKEQALWWQGPTWLPAFRREESNLHTYQTGEDMKVKKVHTVQHAAGTDFIIDELLTKYSSFLKVIHVLAWVRRFITSKQNKQVESFIAVQKIMQDLWRRWRSEYLIQLAARSKWRQPQRNIGINDIVVLHDDNLPPGKWMMGRVIELHEGKDGHVRVITLKTKSGTMKRPIVKVSLLLESEDLNKQVSEQNEICKRQTSDVQVTTRSKTSKSPSRQFSFTSLLTTLMLFLTIISNSQADVNITKFRDNQHLFFDKIADMVLIRNEWKIVVYYNMQPYWQEIKVLDNYMQSLKATCDTLSEHARCEAVLLQLRHGYSELEYYNHMLLSQHKSSRSARLRRRRRGLIDGIGYVANSLFGVLDERFAEQYQKDITLVRENQKHIASLWKNQTTIIEAEYNILKRTESIMNRQHKLVNQHMNELEQAWNNLKDEVQTNNIVNSFNTGAIIANNILENLKSTQNTLLETVTDIYHGRFNFHLLPPEQLVNELSTISSQLQKDVSLPVNNIHTELRKIYELLKVKTRMLDEMLIFEMKLPLISRDTYELLKLLPIPEAGARRATSVVPVSDYISINMKKDMFLMISENELRSCTLLSEVYLCYLRKPEFQVKGDKSFCKKEDSECIIHGEPCENNWNEVNSLNTYMYFCCSQCQVKTICGDQVTAHQLTRAGLIHVEFDCIIKTEEFTIQPHKPHLSEMKMDPGLNTPYIASINHIINITIPKPTLYNETRQQEMSEIGEKISKLRDAQVISDNITYHDIHHYTMIYVVLGVVIITGIILIARRVQCRWQVHRACDAVGADPPPPRPLPPTPRAPREDTRRDRSTSPQFIRIVSN